MANINSDLLFLTINLSLLKSKQLIINLFIEGLSAILTNYQFEWLSDSNEINVSSHLVCTREKSYGYIKISPQIESDKQIFPYFQNALQLLAIILERLEQNELLNNQKAHLQQLVDSQTLELIRNHNEINMANEELATSNEELIETNRSLLESNMILFEEIEKREAVEKRLRDSDKFFNHSTDMFCIAGFDGYFKVLNPTWEIVLGWSKAELLAKPWNEFLHPDDVVSTDEIKSTIVDGKEVYHFDNRYRCKNGEYKWLSWNSYPHREENLMFGVARDITSVKESENRLKQIEWMLDSKSRDIVAEKEQPSYGELTLYNIDGLIVNSIDKDILHDIANDYLGLLETSSAIYEKNGDYAMGIFSSGWCRFMDNASRKLCNTESNTEALNSGKWLCHESCWTDASKKAIEAGKAVDIRCNGGLNLYVEPIIASDKVIGAINFGYGNPPTNEKDLKELAEKYQVSYIELARLSKTYESRPPFIIELAKKRLKYSARQIGALIERSQAENKLKESEAKFRSIIQSSPRGIYIYELNTKGQLIFTGANPSADRIIGIDHELLNGKTIEDAFPNLTNTFVPDLYAKVAKGEAPATNFEIEYADDKAKGYFEVTVYQTIENAIAVEFSDVSERRKSELRLRESEHLLAESQRVSIIGSYTLDIVNDYWKGSLMLDEIFEAYSEDYHTVAGWIDLIHPDDREMMSIYFLNEVIAEKNRFDKVYRITTPISKTTKWVHGIGELEFDQFGVPEKMIGTIQDITYKVQAEEKLRVLTRAIDQSPNSIVITNTKAEIIYVNPVIEKLSGYSKDELIGQNPRIFASGKTSIEEYKKLWGTIISGEVWQGEFQNKKKNGELFWESAIISPVFDNIGKISHFLAIREDVTEQKKMTRELIEAKDKAEESDRLKSAFLANMSHEIRTPMNSIMGFASLLPDEESKELICQYANIIVRNSEQLVHIIDDIVLYSRLQAKILISNSREFNVCDLLHDLKQSFNLPEYSNGIELLVENKINCPFLISTDYEKLRQVFMNLISNAYKYTPAGTIAIGIEIIDNQPIFFVKDTGIGIPKGETEKVFERFYRGTNAKKETVSGTGLGLSIVKELIILLGGTIWIESEQSKGSTFYFTIKGNTKLL